MLNRSAATLSVLAAAAVCGAATAAHQPKPIQAAKAAKPEPAAIVNGQVIGRNDLATELIADQMARINAGNPQYADKQRPVAASVGTLLLKKMMAAGSKPIALSRQELIDFIYADKSQTIIAAVENKIRQVVIAQEAKRRKITASPPQVDAQFKKSIDTARKQMHLPATMSDAKVLSTLGYRVQAVRDGVIASILLEKMIIQDHEKKVGHTLTNDDYVEARHILIRAAADQPAPVAPGAPPAPQPPTDPEKAFTDSKKKMDGVLADIKAGKITFELAAKTHSDDQSKFQEGKLGVFIRGQMVPEFEKAAFGLAAGKTSEPVRTQFGWHLIRVDRVGKDCTPAERETALQTFTKSRVQAFVQEMVGKAKIKNFVAPAATGLPTLQMPGQ